MNQIDRPEEVKFDKTIERVENNLLYGNPEGIIDHVEPTAGQTLEEMLGHEENFAVKSSEASEAEILESNRMINEDKHE